MPFAVRAVYVIAGPVRPQSGAVKDPRPHSNVDTANYRAYPGPCG